MQTIRDQTSGFESSCLLDVRMPVKLKLQICREALVQLRFSNNTAVYSWLALPWCYEQRISCSCDLPSTGFSGFLIFYLQTIQRSNTIRSRDGNQTRRPTTVVMSLKAIKSHSETASFWDVRSGIKEAKINLTISRALACLKRCLRNGNKIWRVAMAFPRATYRKRLSWVVCKYTTDVIVKNIVKL